VKTQHNYR